MGLKNVSYARGLKNILLFVLSTANGKVKWKMENTNKRIFQHLRILGQGLPEVVLAEGEEVCVADTPDVGGPPVAHLAAGDVHDAQLAEHDALAQRHEHNCPVLVDDVDFAALDDVHLPAHIALPAHVVSGGVNLRTQSL